MSTLFASAKYITKNHGRPPLYYSSIARTKRKTAAAERALTAFSNPRLARRSARFIMAARWRAPPPSLARRAASVPHTAPEPRATTACHGSVSILDVLILHCVFVFLPKNLDANLGRRQRAPQRLRIGSSSARRPSGPGPGGGGDAPERPSRGGSMQSDSDSEDEAPYIDGEARPRRSAQRPREF